MRKFVGTGFVALGIVLSTLGLGSRAPTDPPLDGLFTAAWTDWRLLMGGVVFSLVGLLLAFPWRRRA